MDTLSKEGKRYVTVMTGCFFQYLASDSYRLFCLSVGSTKQGLLFLVVWLFDKGF